MGKELPVLQNGSNCPALRRSKSSTEYAIGANPVCRETGGSGDTLRIECPYKGITNENCQIIDISGFPPEFLQKHQQKTLPDPPLHNE